MKKDAEQLARELEATAFATRFLLPFMIAGKRPSARTMRAAGKQLRAERGVEVARLFGESVDAVFTDADLLRSDEFSP